MEPKKESKSDAHPSAGVDFSAVDAVHEEITFPQEDGYVAYGPSGIRGVLASRFVAYCAAFAALGGFLFGIKVIYGGSYLYLRDLTPEIRGSLLVFEELSIVVGIVVSFWITYGAKDIQGHWSWQLPFLLQIFPGVLLGIGAFFLSFSPRWLASKGRHEEALTTLARLRALPTDDVRVRAEWTDIVAEARFQEVVLNDTLNSWKAAPLCWLWNFIIGLITPPLIQETGFGAYVFFAVFCLLSFVWTYFCVPETNSKTLEEMDEVFHDRTGTADVERKARILDDFLCEQRGEAIKSG
ncbi:hypothetical protein CEP52_001144 [Fusarium oligoseptatum]|uniref:Uncharacterized protein n=1 Tax=Fusarium oligoseptatum TaxID=2604345 RepID=A0A428UL96_9HYPO|nr:hypothetical protein CEP52_001144 [Fusarium oligoseptatum]